MTSFTDARGFGFATGNADAAGACERGIEGYNYWRADAAGHLSKAMEADPDFAMPKIALAWILHLARSTAYAGKVSALMQSAEASLTDDDQRGHALLNALKSASTGNGIEAGTALEGWLEDHPNDLFALRLVQFELFWSGRSGWMHDMLERVAPAWSADVPGYGMYLSCRAFANEEGGNYESAERYGREAVDMTPSDPWGAHAVAHVLIMQGRIADGIQWLESLHANWDEANQIKHHLWWHLTLFLLENGEHERILDLLATQIRNPESDLVKAVPDATIDLQNVASMLLRLELRGVDVGERWHQLADICAGRINNHANAFSNAHDMMVLAATGQTTAAHELLRSMEAFVQTGDGSLRMSFAAAGIAVCRAILAHREKDYAGVIAALMPARHDLALVGGSHAQRDVFYQLLIDAAHRVGRADLSRIFLRDVQRIGFEQVQGRTLYRDVAGVATA